MKMGLRANYPEGYEPPETPVHSERGGEYDGTEGSSTPVYISKVTDGVSGATTFYTVPAGMVFLVKGARCPAGSPLNLNSVEWCDQGQDLIFETPIPYPAGTTWTWTPGGPAGQVVGLWGVLETEEIQRKRNFI